MKQTITKCILSVLALTMCISALFSCSGEVPSGDVLSVTIVVTDVRRGIESGVTYVDGYSVSDKKEYRFECPDISPGEEPQVANVVNIKYDKKNADMEVIPIENISVLSKAVFSGRMVFIKGLGACFISSADGVYELNQIKGLNTDYYEHLELADSVAVYGDIISESQEPIIIRASHLEVLHDSEVTAWNDAELAIIEKYEIVDSYAQTKYETPLGDRNPGDAEVCELLALTDAKVKEEYGINNLDNYSVSISEHASKPQKTVTYELYIGGYRTYEEYIVIVDNGGTVLDCRAANAGEYSRFLPYFTIEKLQAAEEKLKEKMSEFGTSSYMYMGINSEGQLCLNFETIVDIDPPKAQFVDGQYITSGCDIDHKHVFGSEVVCDINQ